MFIRIIKHILRMEQNIMANFDKLNDAFNTLSLDVRNAMDEIIELVGQIKNQSDDQGSVDSLTTQINDLAQKVKDTTDSTVNPATPVAPAPAPTSA